MKPADGRIASDLELRGLRWITEQYAARLDHLARCLDRSLRSAQRYARSLRQAGCAEARPLLHGEPSWIWATERGARLAGIGLRAATPQLARLRHIAAVNEVRLHLAEVAPEAEWICERWLARHVDRRQPRPDGLLCRNGEEHAIEVELVAKARARLSERLDGLCGCYDAVIYFCAAATHRQLTRQRSSGRWPALEVRRLPLDRDPRLDGLA